MKTKKTYVITVNYKGAEDTAKCLASLKKSSVPVQAVVVDNTPNDSELEEALAPFENVHLIRAPENLGFGRGNNLGIDWALQQDDCEYVLILNNDATVKPDAIERMQAAMEAHPEAAIVTARIVLAEDESKLWYGGGEVDWRRGGGRVPGVLGPADAPLAMRARYVSFASGCAMLVRRDVLQKHGGFDQRYFMYDEDLELGLRMSAHGWKIWYEPTGLIVHEGQGSLKKEQGGKFIGAWAPNNPNLPFYVYHIMRNRLLTMHAYARGSGRTQFRIYFPLFVVAKLYRFVLNRRWKAVKAMYEGWQAYRKEIRRQKTVSKWISVVKKDIEVFCLVHPKKGVFKYFYYPDIRAVLLFRFSQLLYRKRITRPLAYLCTMLNDLVHGVWIGPKVEAGPGLFLGHPRGLVVNPSTKIGNYCSILQRVTLGGPNVTIGDNVEINAGAQVVSNARGEAQLSVGDNVIIGAGAVVVKDVPAQSVVVGVPAKVVKTIEPSENWIEFRMKRNQESSHGTRE
jgi:GT2 family glycosyltransferase